MCLSRQLDTNEWEMSTISTLEKQKEGKREKENMCVLFVKQESTQCRSIPLPT
mgnify:CR=1 FL=1